MSGAPPSWRLDLGPLVVEHAQRVDLRPTPGVLVEVERRGGTPAAAARYAGRQVRVAERVQQQPELAASPSAAKPVHGEHDQLGVKRGVVGAERLRADLPEVPVTARLRALVAEGRAGVPQLHRQRARRADRARGRPATPARCPRVAASASGRPRSSKVYISFVTTSVDSPTPRTKSAVSSKIGVST